MTKKAALKLTPIDDGVLERGHIARCAECGAKGVFCDNDAGIVDADCRQVYVDFGDDLVCLMAGKADGTCTDEVYCEDCA